MKWGFSITWDLWVFKRGTLGAGGRPLNVRTTRIETLRHLSIQLKIGFIVLSAMLTKT